MSDPKDDLEIIIEDDPPAAPAPVVETPGAEKNGKTKPLAAEEGIEALKAKLASSTTEAASERAAREAAERRAAQSAAEAATATKSAKDGELTLIGNAIGAIAQAQDANKTAYAAALAAGDYTTAAEIQSQMSTNAAKLVQLESGKAMLEEEAKRPPVQRQEIADPVERLAAQLSPRSASWIRSHPDFARSPDMYNRVVRADAAAWGAGIERDSDAYFDHVERTLGLKQDGTRQDAAPPAAPGGHRGVPGENGSRQSVRLSKEEVEMAEMQGMTVQEYAQNKRLLQAEGKMQ
jgi:hypothetical protein